MLYYHYVQFYIANTDGNVLVGVIPIFHSFRDIALNSFAVLIKDMIIPDLFFHSLGQGIQEFTKPEEVDSTLVPVLLIPHDFSNINGIFVAEPFRKNHRSRARTANSEQEEVCLHPAPSVTSQRPPISSKETLSLILLYFITVDAILAVVDGQDFSNLLIIVKT